MFQISLKSLGFLISWLLSNPVGQSLDIGYWQCYHDTVFSFLGGLISDIHVRYLAWQLDLFDTEGLVGFELGFGNFYTPYPPLPKRAF